MRDFGARNLTRVVAAGVIVGGAPLAFAGTANAAAFEPGATSPGEVSPSSGDDVWDNIAQCESGGKWNTNTGNGFSGGLQFTPSTWRAYGGKGSAQKASRAEQISVAKKVVASQGWGAWPSCSKKVGTRGSSSHSSRHHSSHSVEASASRTTSHLLKKSHHRDDDDD